MANTHFFIENKRVRKCTYLVPTPFKPSEKIMNMLVHTIFMNIEYLRNEQEARITIYKMEYLQFLKFYNLNFDLPLQSYYLLFIFI